MLPPERTLQRAEARALRLGARALERLHDELLFIRAFPREASFVPRAERALARVAAAIGRLPARERRRLDDSGRGGTTSRHTFEHAIAEWIGVRHEGEAEFDWPSLPDTGRLDAVMRPLLARGEEDAFDAGLVSTREWLDAAAAGFGGTRVEWMLRSAAAGADRAGFARAYDSAEIPVSWTLRAGATSGSSGNFLAGAAVVARPAMRRPPANIARAIQQTLADIRLARPAEADRVIDVARAALAARCREVYAISNANRHEVWLADLGEGAVLAVIGARPEARLSLESNYGYLLLSNGVPIGYGGVTPLLAQANTGINIFAEFRRSEAAFLWVQMLRAFHSLFGVRRFVVNAVQFGEDNEEAIASGAYWFYDRLGFRPSHPAAGRIADEERRRIAADRSYRTPPSRLRALARGDLHLTLPGYERASFFDERWLTGVSLALTRRVGAEPDADRATAVARLVAQAAAALGQSPGRWPADERASFTRLAPLMALLSDLPRWAARDRNRAVLIMRAKGAPQERMFVLLAQQYPRVILALAALGRATEVKPLTQPRG
ncbi:MAG: hypothetical protein NTZ43_04740 [Gemmatimonadetes bacterium]|nr:hypothetical protein [Gemmatimonadota bacterium]